MDGDYNATISGASSIANLVLIDADTSGTLTYAGISDTAANLKIAFEGGSGTGYIAAATSFTSDGTLTLTGAGNAALQASAGDLNSVALIIDGTNETVNLGTLSIYGGNGTLSLGDAGPGTDVYTVNLGTSGVTTINVLGTGNHNITAAAAVLETFVLGDTDGGGIFQGLSTSDVIDLDAETATNWDVAEEATIGAVDAVGEWFFDAGVLTYYSETSTAAEAIALVGITNLIATADTLVVV